MLHTQLHGTHWQIGFQLGAGLAGTAILSWTLFPFPSPRRGWSLPGPACPLPPVVPRRPGGAAGLAQGRVCPGRTGRGPFSMYAMPPGLLLLLCPAQRGPVRPEQRLSHGAGRAQRQLPIPFFRRRLFFVGNTTSFLQMEDGVNQFGLAAGLTSVPQPTPPRAECWSDPAAPAGILPGCSPGPGAAPAAPRLLLPHAGAGRPGWAYRPGGVCPGAHPDPLSRGDGRLRLLRQFLPPLRHGPLPPADGRRLAGGRALSDPHPLPGRLGPGARPPSWTGPALRQDGLPVPV